MYLSGERWVMMRKSKCMMECKGEAETSSHEATTRIVNKLFHANVKGQRSLIDEQSTIVPQAF